MKNFGIKNTPDVRKGHIKMQLTEEEITEYIKCKQDVQYFANHYCQIKREDGTIGPITLRDYQQDIMDLYTKNRYSILMASRQMGKCLTFDTKINIIIDERLKPMYLGELFYSELKKRRKLTFLEKLKLLLYKLAIWIEK